LLFDLRDLTVVLNLGPQDETIGISIEEIPWIRDVYPKLGQEKESNYFLPYPDITPRPKSSDLMMLLHSSGSTGCPKTIPITHRAQLESCTFCMFSSHKIINSPLTILHVDDLCKLEIKPSPRLLVFGPPPFHIYGRLLIY
jgi:acyl-CoA synthetase (AMP-forming)/AMP-acid ligase II